MTNDVPRGPKLFEPDDPNVVRSPEPLVLTRADDAGDDEQHAGAAPVPPGLRRSWIGWGGILASALASLALLSAGIWFARFVSVAIERDDAIGWTATALVALAALAALVLIGRELVGFFRLGRIGRLRQDADRALAENNTGLEASVVRRVRVLVGADKRRDWDVKRFREEERHMRAPGELMRLGDRVLLAGADKEARRVIFESARRVATVTALLPFAGLVVLFVLRENVRMMRRLAGVYGARPGFAGGVSLLWRTISYIAATGLLALTDDLAGQLLGQDFLRRLSRRLGEGAFNAALTARLGAAAVAVCRPLPFIEAPSIRARDIVGELFSTAAWRKAHTTEPGAGKPNRGQ